MRSCHRCLPERSGASCGQIHLGYTPFPISSTPGAKPCATQRSCSPKGTARWSGGPRPSALHPAPSVSRADPRGMHLPRPRATRSQTLGHQLTTCCIERHRCRWLDTCWIDITDMRQHLTGGKERSNESHARNTAFYRDLWNCELQGTCIIASCARAEVSSSSYTYS